MDGTKPQLRIYGNVANFRSDCLKQLFQFFEKQKILSVLKVANLYSTESSSSLGKYDFRCSGSTTFFDSYI